METALNGTVVKGVVTPRSHGDVLQPLSFTDEP